jgi:MFS family permease
VRPLVLVATSLAGFTATLDNTVVAVAVVDLQADLGVGVTELQGVVTAYTVALAGAAATGGTLADVAGRRRVFVIGLAVFAAASVACALSTTAAALVAARAVQGAGAALVLPGGLAVLAAAFPEPAARARAVGIWAATGAAALVLGPVVGGLLVARYGWPSVFWVNVPLCLAVALVVLVAPAGDPPEEGRRLDLPGQLLAAAGLAAGTWAVVLAGRDGLGAPVLLAGAASVVALVAFAVVERRSADPMLPLPLLRQRSFLGATAGAFAASLAVFVLLVFLSLFLQLVQLKGPLPTGAAAAPADRRTGAGGAVRGAVGGPPGAPRPGHPRPRGVRRRAGGAGAAAARRPGRRRARRPAHARRCRAGPGHGAGGRGLAGRRQPEPLGSGRRRRQRRAELGGGGGGRRLGALAVARLSGDLTGRLTTLGVPDARLEAVVDALLSGATQREVLEVAGDQVPFDALLQLRGAAEMSYVGSVRLALLGAAVVLALSALATARSLPRAPAEVAAGPGG